jgi:bacterioferritin (cytochrome b1)
LPVRRALEHRRRSAAQTPSRRAFTGGARRILHGVHAPRRARGAFVAEAPRVYPAGVRDHDSIESLRPKQEDVMPKKVAAPKKGATTSKDAAPKKAVRAKKSAGARKPVVELMDDMMDDEMTLPAKKAAGAKKPAGARKAAAVQPDELDEMDFPEDAAPEAPARKAAAPRSKGASAKLVQLLNESLGWELRAQAMYAHYAAYVKGLESITLAEHFEGEVTESLGHAKKVRDIIAALGAEAVSTRDDTEIVHTEDTRVMLEEALKTESAAAAAYQKIVPLVKDHPVFYHAIYHILKDETAAVIEVETLLGR